MLAVVIIFTSYSCKKEGNETNISQHNQSNSHNIGRNCMDCHKSGGEGKGWFVVAGTAYTNAAGTSTLANSTVKIYSEKNGGGTLLATINGDALGNFFTTENINFGTGVYPSITGTGAEKFMGSSITNGQCSSCHGGSQGKIWAQ